MRSLVCLLTFVIFTTPVFAAEINSPGAIKTLAMVTDVLSYAVPFQEKFDRLCNPIYKKAVRLKESQRDTYLYNADQQLSKQLNNGDEISCRGKKGYFNGANGHAGNIVDGKTRAVSFSFADNKGRILIVYDSKTITYNYLGQKVVFSFDREDPEKNRVLRINVPDFAKACFARYVQETETEGTVGMLPTAKQKEILEQVYWHVAKKENAPSFFIFYKDLLKNPKPASLQVLALHDRYLAAQKSDSNK